MLIPAKNKTLEDQVLMIDSCTLQFFFLNPSVDPVRFFLPNLYNPNTLSKKSIETVRAESPQERYINFIVYNANRNMAHFVVLKISCRFKFSAEIIENV